MAYATSRIYCALVAKEYTIQMGKGRTPYNGKLRKTVFRSVEWIVLRAWWKLRPHRFASPDLGGGECFGLCWV